MAAAALAAAAVFPLASSFGHGELDEELVEHFEEHLERFDSELVRMSEKTDQIVQAYRAGRKVDPLIDEWIELWEEVGVHGVIETKSPYLYPAIWQGVYAMKEVEENRGEPAEMKRAGEFTKAALWQGLGGLRVLAITGPASSPSSHDGHGHDGLLGGIDPDEQPIEAIIIHLEAAVEEYAHGDAEHAQELVFDAYLHIFEGLEGDLIEAKPELVTKLELEFNAGLPNLFKKGAPPSAAKAKVEAMTKDLLEAKKLLAEIEADRSAVF